MYCYFTNFCQLPNSVPVQDRYGITDMYICRYKIGIYKNVDMYIYEYEADEKTEKGWIRYITSYPYIKFF